MSCLPSLTMDTLGHDSSPRGLGRSSQKLVICSQLFLTVPPLERSPMGSPALRCRPLSRSEVSCRRSQKAVCSTHTGGFLPQPLPAPPTPPRFFFRAPTVSAQCQISFFFFLNLPVPSLTHPCEMSSSMRVGTRGNGGVLLTALRRALLQF